jgi:hypothetical protein
MTSLVPYKEEKIMEIKRTKNIASGSEPLNSQSKYSFHLSNK